MSVDAQKLIEFYDEVEETYDRQDATDPNPAMTRIPDTFTSELKQRDDLTTLLSKEEADKIRNTTSFEGGREFASRILNVIEEPGSEPFVQKELPLVA